MCRGKDKSMETYIRKIEQLAPNVIHVMHSCDGRVNEGVLINKNFQKVPVEILNYQITEEGVVFCKNSRTFLEECEVQFAEATVYRYEEGDTDEVIIKQTANGEVACKGQGKKVFDYMSHSATIKFKVNPDKMITGLGQMEDEPLDLRNQKIYLYQTNLRIAVPFLISADNYAILLDTESAVIYENKDGEITFQIDVTEDLSYYVIFGNMMDELIYWYRELTGTAELFPRWLYGYVQSKEKYGSAGELEKTVEEFRKRHIPIDCIVQDWKSWAGDLWGEKIPDLTRYPDLMSLIDGLHDKHTRLMWSIWPNMSPDSENYKEFEEHGLLLPNSNTYDAYRKEGRDLYWKQCDEILFQSGMDAWWCDNSEPFSDAEWNGEEKREDQARYEVILEESKQHMPWERVNSYGLYHAKGIYDSWRKSNPQKRVVNLTRATYLSGQKYGVIPWSGDITATWQTLRNQITEGLRMSLSGFPYWTLDIGGFFVINEKWQNRGCDCHDNSDPLWFWKGDYNEGVNDLGYRELYTRWLQLGAFLPMFRSHGTDTPREPWNFNGRTSMFYDSIVKYIRLRYQLLPYIYSTAAAVYKEHYSMMRSFLFDFPKDEKAVQIQDSFLFGPSFLVAPVLEPMYFEKNNQIICNHERIRSVYLPKGTKWYDFWTNKCFEGGVEVKKYAPIDVLPLYVRAGAIIPCSEPIEYADEKQGEVSEIRIYEGADGRFTFYNDAGDDYSYQSGNYCAMEVVYSDSDKTITFGQAEGKYPYQEEWHLVWIRKNGHIDRKTVSYRGKNVQFFLEKERAC